MSRIDTDSLPDGAAYWWDVKAGHNYFGSRYLHLSGRPCGKSTGGGETEYLSEVSCNKCKKTDEYKVQDEKENPKCSCGARMIVRSNSQTKQKFLGCSKYPKCKNTKHIANQ